MKHFVLFLLTCVYAFAEAHILCYHRFDETSKPSFKYVNVSTSNFIAQINSIKADGRQIVPLSRIVSNLKNYKEGGVKEVAITIDDAYKSFYEKAFPILRDSKIPFTLFVYVEAIDKKYGDYMSWEQIREVSKYGEIALHSYSHKDLTKMSVETLKADTLKGIESFQKQLSVKPRYYAYPFGLYDPKVKNTLKSMGFEAIFTVDSGAVNSYSDQYMMERIAVGENVNLKLALKVRALDVVLDKQKDGTISQIKGSVKNYDGKKVKMFVSRGNIKTIMLDKNGSFDVPVATGKINDKQRLVFFTDTYRYRAKLIQKD